MKPTPVTDGSFETDVLRADVPVLVDFWAEWCGPCKMVAPFLDDLATEMEGKVTIAKVNIDENPQTPQKYGIRGIPTMLLFKDGKVAATKIGALPKSKLYEWVRVGCRAATLCLPLLAQRHALFRPDAPSGYRPACRAAGMIRILPC